MDPNKIDIDSKASNIDGPTTSKNVDGKVNEDPFEVNSRPICMIVLGMAGSGKTSFVKRLTQLADLQNTKPYVINLDPACQEVPYHANIGML